MEVGGQLRSCLKDGTISDPLEGIIRSINYALAHFGDEPLPFSELAKYIGALFHNFEITLCLQQESPLIKGGRR
jgi:phosphoglycolate phosphatase-like HAD superfamily hydrolase